MHDDAHGVPLIDALARHGDGLPANVLPVAVNEITQVGLETIAAAFAYGAAAVRLLMRAKPRHDVPACSARWRSPSRSSPASASAAGAPRLIETDDPDALGETLRAIEPPTGARPASFLPAGGKRDVLRLALRELHLAARSRSTSCRCRRARRSARSRSMSRAARSASPAFRLPDRRARRRSRAADAALRRGRLRAMRPVPGDLPREGDHARPAARLPRRDRAGARAQAGRAVPLHPLQQAVRHPEHDRARRSPSSKASTGCTRAGDRRRMDIIRMCEDCRVIAASEQDFDPYGAPPRPPPRTTEDYLREREERERMEKGEG